MRVTEVARKYELTRWHFMTGGSSFGAVGWRYQKA
ncbi:hypothetical protein MEA186_31786 [Mesorhizobium amorphae CCNWGS0123]|uniref:Uncharacterized protein n=1 Tax=Mesorhizobium amorphae CCNWGS0123 TaxID=1082933 RepID=G6YK23_9HYPH|nr:hypothetical protein MEA186_31786 [Mesorhizobium amorphae CCNWGS0123]